MKTSIVALPLLILALGALPALGQTSNAELNCAMAAHLAGNIQLALQDYQQAATQCKQAGNIQRALYGAAACLFSLKQYSSAISEFAFIAQTYPASCFAGMSLVSEGDVIMEESANANWSDAENCYQAALQLQLTPADMETFTDAAHLGLGRVLYAQGLYSSAEAELQTAITLANHIADTDVAERAYALYLQCQSAGSQASTSVSAQSSSLATQADLSVARTYVNEGKYGQALPLLEKAAVESTDGNVLAESAILTAQSQAMTGRNKEALKSLWPLSKISDASPAFLAKKADWTAYAAYWQAKALIGLGRGAEAAAVCEKALAQKNTAVGIERVKDLELLDASALMQAGNLNGALDALRKIRSLNISKEYNLTADCLAGDYYAQAGKTADAIKAYQRVIDEGNAPNDVKAAMLLKMAGVYRSGADTAKARDCLREMLAKYPVTALKGQAEKELKDWAAAPYVASKGGKAL